VIDRILASRLEEVGIACSLLNKLIEIAAVTCCLSETNCAMP